MMRQLLMAAGAAAVVAPVKAYANLFAVELHRLELRFAQLPAAFDGFRILHLSDTHTRKWDRLEKRVGRIIDSNEADVVVFTGDLVTTASGIEPFRQLVRSAVERCPTFIVFGNTEHKYWDTEYLVRSYESIEARVLVNDSVYVERGGERVYIVGVDDPFTGHAKFGQAFAGVPDDAFKVLLAHAPHVADLAVRHGVSLMLSGHTHGGQIRLPVKGALNSHLPRYRQLAMGLFEGQRLNGILGEDSGDLKLYVSRGIGSSYVPARVLCPPEVPLYVLRRG